MFALQRVSLKSSPALLDCPGVLWPQRGAHCCRPLRPAEKNKQTLEKHLRLLIPAFTGPFSHTVWTGSSGKLRHRRWGRCGGSLSDQNRSRNQTHSEKTPSGQERSGVPLPLPPQLLQVTTKGTAPTMTSKGGATLTHGSETLRWELWGRTATKNPNQFHLFLLHGPTGCGVGGGRGVTKVLLITTRHLPRAGVFPDPSPVPIPALCRVQEAGALRPDKG